MTTKKTTPRKSTRKPAAKPEPEVTPFCPGGVYLRLQGEVKDVGTLKNARQRRDGQWTGHIEFHSQALTNVVQDEIPLVHYIYLGGGVDVREINSLLEE